MCAPAGRGLFYRPSGRGTFVSFWRRNIPLCGAGSFARSGKGTKALLRGKPLRTPEIVCRLTVIAKFSCFSACVSSGGTLYGLPLYTRPFRFAKGSCGGLVESSVLSVSHTGSLLHPTAAGASHGGESVKCLTAAGRNARGGTVSPFNTHAPAIKEHRTAGIREFLEPQVLSQLLPTFVWRQK